MRALTIVGVAVGVLFIAALIVGAFVLGRQDRAKDATQVAAAPTAGARTNGPAPPAAARKPKLPHMELQAQYAGPFEDTIIQRWRDPIDGRICYTYIPAQVKRVAASQEGFIDYGANTIGSISCAGPSGAPALQSGTTNKTLRK